MYKYIFTNTGHSGIAESEYASFTITILLVRVDLIMMRIYDKIQNHIHCHHLAASSISHWHLLDVLMRIHTT